MGLLSNAANLPEKQDKKMLIAIMIAAFGIILFAALALMFQE
ncbi:MAG: hypothetical protein AAB553_07390 [Patescibacteria group bacterium]